MQSTPQAANPFEWWMQINLAMMNASIGMMTATTSAMGAPLKSEPETRNVAHVPRPAPAATEPRGRSWYRAPYRSPFDPMFWMMPGHPVDHVGDWLAPTMAMAGATIGNPFTSAFANGLSAWPSASWMAPMVSWQDFMLPRDGARASLTAPYSNVVDFERAYSSYRTAGGHASAPIIRDSAARTVEPLAEPATAGVPAFWAMLFPMMPWGR